ncbi:hypothetical protein [Gordonia sp. (in: high G+C Gram-positive bacteria)]|uniref:hypothetical protein n=1 Tax=Gordonia sp. (in: high G+C Gram-positive bacteria) TaxID=84139 RepID=UPI001D7955CE|nr:hypothetical protein [Gordonia sp. (in: high G+C Gram-positive bacteria)]MCB1296921.1 hypothetical protein [Gordonia sp. (in: high G+C Gram-positive bacteria)]HMS77087.1 hypothetical protein [Gordonia sp. (in: high G+C Gram-positive bacteria)]HQV16798.1 hypothetical protein [Gordonia sp. (in: high G+C Gram-positive bacteria)]
MDGQNPPAAQETLATTAEQLYVKGYAEGYAKGYAEGLTETQASLLTYMLAGEFGALDNNTRRRVAHATREQIWLWASKLAQGAKTLDDILAS